MKTKTIRIDTDIDMLEIYVDNGDDSIHVQCILTKSVEEWLGQYVC